MGVDSVNQQTARDALTALLVTKLTGANNPVQAAFGFDVATFENQSPVVVVKSGKADRTLVFLGAGKAHVWFYYNVEIWVALGDENAPTWTDQNVEDTHNLIEKMIADVLADNKRAAAWDLLGYAAPATEPSGRMAAGLKWRVRMIPVRCRIIGG